MNKLKVSTASSRFRPATWLKKSGYAPHVYLFRNLEQGQVLYSQLPQVTNHMIEKTFKKKVDSWMYKKPSTRRDLWKCMCVVNMKDYDDGVLLFQNLQRLRFLRDFAQLDKANEFRKKDSNGHVWYSGKFRPTFAQEAVADLRESLIKMQKHDKIEQEKDTNEIDIYWEDPWRMGDLDKYWTPVLSNVNHKLINNSGNTAREESVILKEISTQTLNELSISSSSSSKVPFSPVL
ncbi:mitochondrial 54S ribosomal protein mL67 NDAI_0C04080 [Naumovozyma dairenensis CBS 421]|uniref:Large ribosomal subunit protein mL67 n=1 Tax=Naumovozyma dairenensis (strain ATCC 10597 / BCRC 20456 / CBS 421 / NBRC 0211 / NRRL Y-12639) TaxID=1071378 RepID=G0W8F7_NAUDC|nr:hypothetical protein NDAI_0C04080 [Naumovozyma dairenensis CBS 421]CCD24068.1 hypothetical protein NDAI_0C04080 [Naumovozyma dairenensis CBS 421]